MAATLTLPDLDVDLLGHALVAEIEAYLASQPLPPAPSRLTVPQVSRYGRVVHQWDHGIDRGRITARQFLGLMDRYIHQHGWTQGLLWDTAGRVCLLGARARILAAGYGTPGVDEQARLLIGNAIRMPLDTWNDAEGRTIHDIHNLLQATAARAAG